jgi:hypothetical protein
VVPHLTSEWLRVRCTVLALYLLSASPFRFAHFDDDVGVVFTIVEGRVRRRRIPVWLNREKSASKWDSAILNDILKPVSRRGLFMSEAQRAHFQNIDVQKQHVPRILFYVQPRPVNAQKLVKIYSV